MCGGGPDVVAERLKTLRVVKCQDQARVAGMAYWSCDRDYLLVHNCAEFLLNKTSAETFIFCFLFLFIMLAQDPYDLMYCMCVHSYMTSCCSSRYLNGILYAQRFAIGAAYHRYQ